MTSGTDLWSAILTSCRSAAARGSAPHMGGVANALLGGWEILGIDAFQTGFPQTISRLRASQTPTGRIVRTSCRAFR